MAARRRTATRSGGEIVVVNAAPVARRSGGGGIRRRRSSGRRRRRGKGGGGGGASTISRRLQQTAMGGFGYGLLVKNWPNMPRVPGIGRSGTIALAIYLLKPKNQILQDIGVAAAAIAGYSFGETGTVSGDSDVLQDD